MLTESQTDEERDFTVDEINFMGQSEILEQMSL